MRLAGVEYEAPANLATAKRVCNRTGDTALLAHKTYLNGVTGVGCGDVPPRDYRWVLYLPVLAMEWYMDETQAAEFEARATNAFYAARRFVWEMEL